ncbi:hypothetical protein OS493_030669 [Desmophyllum pertusum]|uniref:HECT domain-containing protein n=1 Tax=Desmophyllum pertusum TaxID=174260 RepID=A0A9W9Z907_9CNID|nr:hypothetical protein OS493_030669 [Desmophyllum pertusum]
MPADHILNVFKARVVKDAGPTMAITFNRSKKAIRELCRIYKNSSAKLSRQPVVYFVSKTGEDEEYEEEAADVGGPMREFLSLATETVLSCSEPQLFEGCDDHKVPVHSQQLVLNGYFRMVGEIMAHAIIHGEVWITGLAKPVKEFLSSGCAESATQVVCLEDIADLDVHQVLQRMAEADEDEITRLNSEDMVSNLMAESGVSAAFLTVNNVSQVAYEIMVYQVIHKRMREIDEAAIDMEVLEKRLSIDPTTAKSNANNTAYKFFLEYLGNVCKRTEGIMIKDVLGFLTGSALMPRNINVKFAKSNTDLLPDPNTCLMEVDLPICHATYEDFSRAFDSVVRIQGKGYGRS